MPAALEALQDGRRSFAAVGTTDQWLRCAHDGTALDVADGVVSLDWTTPPSPAVPTGPLPSPAGLAFDSRGCLYRGDPDEGRILRVAWRPRDPLSGLRAEQEVVDLLAADPPPSFGDFGPAGAPPAPSFRPVAVAADTDEHLFVLDAEQAVIVVLDLTEGRRIRTVELPARPVDLAAAGRAVYVAVADREHPLWWLEASRHAAPVALPDDVFAGVDDDAEPVAVAAGPGGEVWLLVRAPGGQAWAVPALDPRASAPVGPGTGVTDVALDGDGNLVVAGLPGEDFVRVALGEGADAETRPLQARDYDGRGIVRTPDGGIGFWSGSGFRLAVEARVRYVTSGHVDLFRLDGGSYRCQWGRVFVDACLPPGTAVRASFVTSDDEPGELEADGPSIARTVPANLQAGTEVPPAEPPLVATERVPDLARTYPLHRRETGMELPWVTAEPGDRFETYESPVHAPPGRWLWVRLELHGTVAAAPRVRAVRVERPGHDLMRRLPRAYSRDPVSASFLYRYLALTDGLLDDLVKRAAQRDYLLDAFGAPAEMLPWLGSLVGLTLDQRWSERARRTMLAEAICLFRRRGTMAGLRRMLQIYLDCDVTIMERFRVRGVGGALLGDEGPAATSSVVGFGLRVGGGVGEETTPSLGAAAPDAFETHAHRFAVLVPRDLDEEEHETLDRLLELHRPAHTLVEVCTVGAGMRVGIGLHVELTSIVGPSAGWRQAELGAVRLDRDAVVGRPAGGLRPGGSRVGVDTRVDA